MAAEEIFTTVNSRDLWRALTLKECLRFSPQFQLALKTGECELEYLLEHYRIASDLFYRASKAGETFASALQALGGGLLSILTPSTALPLITLDDETATETAVSRLKPLIKKLTDVSELTKTLAVNLYEPGVQLQTAAEQLEKLNPLRKAFSRAGEQLESTLNKSASVPRNRVVEAEEADSGLEDSRSTFSTFAHSYLSALRAGLGPSRLATCLRCTFITFRTESDYAQGLRGLFQPFDYQVPLDWRGELERLLGASEEDARRGADQASGPPVRPTGGVLIEGNLFKRSHKKHWRTWDRRWFMIANNQLVYFTGLEHLKGGSGAKGSTNEICGGEGSQAAVLKSPTDTTTVSRIQWKIVEPDLRLCTAKAILSSSTSNDTMAVQGQTQDTASSSERRFTFELISPNGKKHYLQALNEEEMDQWVTILRAGLLHGDISYRPGVPSPKTSAHRRSLSRPTMLFPQEDKTEERKASINFSRSYDCLRTTGGAQLLDDPPGTGNRLCADCASDRVSWASTNLGLTLCTDCAACHRGLGVHISKVRSLFLDNWEPELIAVMRNLGNRIGGSIFEASLTSPPSKSSSPTVSKNSFNNSSRDVGLLADVKRPQPGQGSASNKQVRQNWIEMKYAACRFVDFPGSSLADLKSRILDLYRNWRTQMQTASSDDNRRGGVLHDRSASPRTSVITVLSGPALGRVAKVVDRRRPSASPRLISRSQMFLGKPIETWVPLIFLLRGTLYLQIFEG
uniref:Arf-GAP with coiled-coil, ANK repeat and PH domain-containing protein 2 n=1 Tax=Schistocephalus solidus TaxID=70667 RepID=A0A0X3NKK9_SCHSO